MSRPTPPAAGPFADLPEALAAVSACDICKPHLPMGPRPVVQIGPAARVLLIGQAPGVRVHKTGLPFNDPSGDRLRRWLQISRETFYDPAVLNIMPMGFCYPGTGAGGDLPPRPECAPTWHHALRALMPNLRTTLLVGSYAIHYYLGPHRYKTVADTVRHWQAYAPQFLVFPHPSPRNIRWLAKHSWFEAEVIPAYREILAPLLS